MRDERLRRRWSLPILLLGLSFLPFLVKSVSYAWIGSYVPLLVFCFLAGLVAWGLRSGSRALALALRTWAVALALWGLARLTVMALFLLTSVSEAHIESHLTAGYVLASGWHVLLAIYLFRYGAGRHRAAEARS